MNSLKAPDLLARIASARPDIATLTIYRISATMRTFVVVSARALESFPEAEIERVEERDVIESALEAVVASEPEPSQRVLDARYGLVFENAASERVLSIYKGAFATRGQIDEVICDYNETALHTWLTERYRD